MSIDLITLWHERARPNPGEKEFNVQLGCHIEEFVEMLDSLTGLDPASDSAIFVLAHKARIVAEQLKAGKLKAGIPPSEREAFLDSLCDQVVTSAGVGHCAGMNVTEGVRRVNASNWSKYDTDGQPIFDANGKIAKGPRYAPPDLEGLY